MLDGWKGFFNENSLKIWEAGPYVVEHSPSWSWHIGPGRSLCAHDRSPERGSAHAEWYRGKHNHTWPETLPACHQFSQDRNNSWKEIEVHHFNVFQSHQNLIWEVYLAIDPAIRVNELTHLCSQYWWSLSDTTGEQSECRFVCWRSSWHFQSSSCDNML